MESRQHLNAQSKVNLTNVGFIKTEEEFNNQYIKYADIGQGV